MWLLHFVALFDESHNKVEKQGQMDLHIQFWYNSEDIVASRYYSSEYLDKAADTDICYKVSKVFGSIAERENVAFIIIRPKWKLTFSGDENLRDENEESKEEMRI